MTEPLYLSIDIGTGSVRAGLVGRDGRLRHVAAREHEQIVPRYGWSEQRPSDWWAGALAVVREAAEWSDANGGRIEAVCACGQMHGTVLVDADGEPVLDAVPLWNDKRTASYVERFETAWAPEDYLPLTANPASPAWPAFKLQWLRDNVPDAYRLAASVLMPKDYINFKLTGERAIDRTDAALSFLMDPADGAWSAEMALRLDLDAGLLPPIRQPGDVLGAITEAAAGQTGLRAGTPVLVGAGDYPMAMLGSGVSRPGLASDVAGTSSIVTLIAEQPVLDAALCNVGTADGRWGVFTLLESGGDAMRWARRAFHDNGLSYEEITARASEAPAGAEGLFFLPYLVGERLGRHRNARAQFFGLAAGHGNAHLHRAIMEGVGFAVARQMRIMQERAGVTLERVVASGGGAKAALWPRIKASIYNLPIIVPEEAECGLVGCAALAAHATGQFNRLEDAVAAFVRTGEEILPDPEWAERYARMQPVFDQIHEASQPLYDALDGVSAG